MPVGNRLVAGPVFTLIVLAQRVVIASLVGAYYVFFFIEDALRKRGAR